MLTSASAIFHVVSGDGESEIDGHSFTWQQGDVIAVPSQLAVRHCNRSRNRPAYLLQVDNSPLQSKLGWYREWAERAPAVKSPAAQIVLAHIARSPIKETA